MLQSLFDQTPKPSIVRIIVRLAGLSSPSGSDLTMWNWFRANLRWTPARPGADPQLMRDGLLGRALFGLEQITDGTGDNSIAGFWDSRFSPGLTGRYPTFNTNCPGAGSQSRVLVATILWESYSALCTCLRHQGPNTAISDLDAVIASTT